LGEVPLGEKGKNGKKRKERGDGGREKGGGGCRGSAHTTKSHEVTQMVYLVWLGKVEGETARQRGREKFKGKETKPRNEKGQGREALEKKHGTKKKTVQGDK